MLLILTGLLGLIAVGCGAFGAHGLEGRLSPKALGWWETATLYLLVHTAALAAVALSGRTGAVVVAGCLFAAGSVVFSGTLYAMALGAPTWLGAITPIGGLLLMAGWAALLVAGIKS